MTILLQNLTALYQYAGHEARNADVLIDGHRIAAIGAALPVPDGARVIDGRGKVAIPGLINTHHHFFQILTRCLPGAQDAKLFDWLTYHYRVWKYLDAAAIAAAARLAMSELLLTGCTTTADHHYLFPRHISEDLIGLHVAAARELGIRYVGTRGSMTLGDSDGGLPPDEIIESNEQVLRQSEEAISRWHDPAPFAMNQIHLAPCSPFNVTTELMRDSALLARRHGVRLHTHLAETQDEIDFCLERYHRRPLELMEDLGWVADDVWFAHGVHFTDDELALLARAGCGIAHCPSSNMRLGSGAARIPAMLARGVPVGLAVDGSASNDSSDMLGELRQAMLLGRLAWGVDALTARQVVSLATEGSARVLGRTELGTLAIGQAADVALFDLEQLGYAGAADPIAALLFCGYNHTVHTVIVNGQIVVEDGHLTRADETTIRRSAVTHSTNLWKRAGVR